MKKFEGYPSRDFGKRKSMDLCWSLPNKNQQQQFLAHYYLPKNKSTHMLQTFC